MLLASGYVSGLPRVRSDESKWLVTAHAMWSHNSSQSDALLTTLSVFSNPTPANNPTPYSGGTGDLDIAFSGNNYLLVWRMNTLSAADNYVAGRIMNPDGTFGPDFTIAQAAGRQLRPTVAWDGSAFVVAWEDQRNQAAFFDAQPTSATRVSEAGVVLGPALAVAAGPEGVADHALASRDGVTLVASSRFTATGRLTVTESALPGWAMCRARRTLTVMALLM